MRFSRSTTFIAVLTMLLFAGSRPILAQPGQGRCQMMQPYDAATEIVLEGTIEEVDKVDCPQQGQGVHLKVTSDGKLYEVRLGPDWFVTERESFAVTAGDSVTVTGSVGDDAEVTILVAREIVSAEKTLVLRDESGVPAWAGEGRGRRSRS